MSMETIIRTHSAQVYRHAYRLTGNRSDAEDLAQESFVRALRAMPDGTSDGTPHNLDAWFSRVTRNLFLDQVRRSRRIGFVALADRPGTEPVDTRPGPSDVLDGRVLDADIEAALRSLSPDLRAAVVLRDLDGLSYDEVAAATGAGLGTVRSRIHRARRQLHDALDHRARPVR
ncbi:sigma-70 family RNA polymerase sigma factor [Mumia sp. DW29H23]|uniref:sigma-70 family RNA polymerase sigma factor n=1 Tax=Mumia sp. DW29H23 TaxID=3421241 RepID=UPI003D680A4D